jgi:hypothetical protein
VSVATVSRYINQNVPVSEKLSGRIQQVMDDLNYVPQATARNLALRKTQTIGLLVTNLHNDLFAGENPDSGSGAGICPRQSVLRVSDGAGRNPQPRGGDEQPRQT